MKTLGKLLANVGDGFDVGESAVASAASDEYAGRTLQIDLCTENGSFSWDLGNHEKYVSNPSGSKVTYLPGRINQIYYQFTGNGRLIIKVVEKR